MSNQPLAFAELLFGGVLITMAITGHGPRDILSGDITPRGLAGDIEGSGADNGAASLSGNAASTLAGETYTGNVHLPAGHGPLYELFWQGPGGINVKNNQVRPQGFVKGHTDHVHVASDPKTVDFLSRLAQQQGLTVRENEPFDHVDPVHVRGSYHFTDRAADISGPVDKMRAFARQVASLFGLYRLQGG